MSHRNRRVRTWTNYIPVILVQSKYTGGLSVTMFVGLTEGNKLRTETTSNYAVKPTLSVKLKSILSLSCGTWISSQDHGTENVLHH